MDAQRPTALSTGTENPTVTDTRGQMPTGVNKKIGEARQKKQDGLEFPQNICRIPVSVNRCSFLGDSVAMPVCPCWRTRSVLRI